MSASVAPAAVAEDAIGWLATGSSVARVEHPDVILIHRPLSLAWYGVATRVRVDGDPARADAVIAGARAWFADRARDRFSWMIGWSASPDMLTERLLAAGAWEESVLTAMVLEREPPPGPPDIEIREVRTLEDFAHAARIEAEGFGFPADLRDALEAEHEAAWAHWRDEPGRRQLLAWIDGVAVAEAVLAPSVHGPLVLAGGATLAAWRGRGAYRALVRWRWDEAVRRGAGALVVQASDDSRPVLERLGFQAVGPVRTFGDRAAASDRTALA